MSRGAELLYRFRVAKQLSQDALAKLIVAHPISLHKWEIGRVLPGLHHAVRLELFSHGAIPCGSWLVALPQFNKELGDQGIALARSIKSLLEEP